MATTRTPVVPGIDIALIEIIDWDRYNPRSRFRAGLAALLSLPEAQLFLEEPLESGPRGLLR